MGVTTIVLVLFLSVLVSGFGALFIKPGNKLTIKLLLSFSGAYLFAICMLHLLPETYSEGGERIGIFVLAGFFIQILLEFFSEGIEHGHVHIHKSKEHTFPLAIILSLCIHSFLEGMPLAGNDYATTRSLLFGIVFHNIPIALALMSMLIQSQVKTSLMIWILLIFAAMAPLGLYTSDFISGETSTTISEYTSRIMGIVIGIFLHISTTILFESSENHRFNLKKFVMILIGAGLAIITI